MRSMFSSPTAIRVLKKQDAGVSCKKHDLSSAAASVPRRRAARRADARWIADALGEPRRSTTTGRPRPAGRSSSAQPGVEDTPRKFGSPSFPVYGYDVQLLHEATGDGRRRRRERRASRSRRRCRPGCMTTVWGDDERFVNTYFTSFPDQQVYSTFDWGMRDEDGYYFDARPHRRRDQRRRATGSARARSRRRCRRIRTSPRSRWSAWPIRSRGRCRSRSPS